VTKNEKLDTIIALLEAITFFFKGWKKLSGAASKIKSGGSHSSNCSKCNKYEQNEIRTYYQSNQ